MLGIQPRTTARSAPKNTLIFSGASNCFGTGSTDAPAHGTLEGTSYAARTVGLLGVRGNWFCANYGQSSLSATAALQLFNDNDTFRSLCGRETIVVVELGGNDLSNNGTAAALQADLTALAQAITNRGSAVIACPILSRTTGFSSGQTQSGFDAARAVVNAWLATSPSPFRAVVATDPDLHNNGAASVATFFTDQIHLTDTGHYRYAELITNAIRSVSRPKFASWRDGLVSWYPLTGPTNGFWVDIVSGIDLVAVGTVGTSTDGRNGKTCVSLPGNNTNYLRAGTVVDERHKLYSGTIAGWVKGTAGSIAYGHLFGTGAGYGFYQSNAAGGTGLMDWGAFQPAQVMNAINGNWNHIATRFELRVSTHGPLLKCQNFLNGVASGSPYTTTTSGFNVFCMGSRDGGNAAQFLANDVMVFNRLLTNEEIGAMYLGTSS